MTRKTLRIWGLLAVALLATLGAAWGRRALVSLADAPPDPFTPHPHPGAPAVAPACDAQGG